jgi:ribosomal protein S18 acetylase RimI-like enzyme
MHRLATNLGRRPARKVAAKITLGVPYRKADIRPFRRGDESILFNLARDAFGEEHTWSDAGTITALATDTVFVAELGGGPAGYVAVERTDDAMRIEQLLVNPLHAGEGVGRQLLEYAEGYAISVGAVRLQVIAEGNNQRALDLYRRLGFGAIGDDLYELVLPEAQA